MKRKVLVCDYVHSDLLAGLVHMGIRPVYAPEIRNQDIPGWLREMEGIIVNTRSPVRKELIEQSKDLRYIGRLGAGLDIIDTTTADRLGICVMNTPGANANAVAEHMFGMLLSLFCKIPHADATVRQGRWLREQHRGRELKGLTIGIIGFGNTGSALARKFASWETEVLAYDKYKAHYADQLRFVEETTLKRVMKESDIISLHVPLTEVTLGMVNSAFIHGCKHGVVILNGSRGKVIVTKDLITALQNGRVSGACLDVLENEKLDTFDDREKADFRSIIKMPNVVFTPHIAGWTYASKLNIAHQLLEGISEFYKVNTARKGNVS